MKSFRNYGEALHPESYDVEALERIQRAVGPERLVCTVSAESCC